VGEGRFEGPRGLKPGIREGGGVWRTKLKIGPFGLDIGGTSGEPSANDGVSM
jgi:hypothetical protein